MTKSLEELRKPKLNAWNANREKLPRVARPQHDERGPARGSAPSTKDEGDRPGDRFREAAAGAVQGDPWSEELIDSMVAELALAEIRR